MKHLRFRTIVFASLISVLSIVATTLGFIRTTEDLTQTYYRPMQVAHYRLLLQNYYRDGGLDGQLKTVFESYVLSAPNGSTPVLITNHEGLVLYGTLPAASTIALDAYPNKFPVVLSLRKQLWIVYPNSSTYQLLQLLEKGKFTWVLVLILSVLLVCAYFGINVAFRFEKVIARARDRDVHRIDDAFSREVIGFIDTIKKDTLSTSEQIEKLKQFNATIAHELRNQLNTISVAVDVLSYSPDAASAKTVTILQNEIKHITRLVNDLHLLSLIEVGRLGVTPQAMPMHAVVEYIVSAARSRSVPVELRYSVSADAHLLTAYIDEERFRQVIDNLIDNAVRHSDSNGIVDIRLSRAESDCLISVCDTGSGIPAEDVDFLFHRFYRASNARGKGSGLGLAIAHEIIQAHSGTIGIQSTLGVGTCIEIRVPLSTLSLPMTVEPHTAH
ncbi:MAG: hypothetical protein RLY87_665 [Chloroflexota bacterium]